MKFRKPVLKRSSKRADIVLIIAADLDAHPVIRNRQFRNEMISRRQILHGITPLVLRMSNETDPARCNVHKSVDPMPVDQRRLEIWLQAKPESKGQCPPGDRIGDWPR